MTAIDDNKPTDDEPEPEAEQQAEVIANQGLVHCFARQEHAGQCEACRERTRIEPEVTR